MPAGSGKIGTISSLNKKDAGDESLSGKEPKNEYKT